MFAFALMILCLVLLLSITHTAAIQYTGGSTSSSTIVSYSAGAENNIGDTFAIGTNVLIAFTADVSQQKAIYILSSTDATLKTNSSGSPAATITLVGGQPILWSSTDGQANPFGSTDITALYLTNAAETVFTLKTLVDPTV